MISFFQKYRVFWIVVAFGLSMFGLVLWGGRDAKALVLFTIPGLMLGVFMYLINNNKSNPTKASNEADELLKWYQLKESGAISEAEYEVKKKEIIG
ncbi:MULTISPECIES: SHOCT domain-containing protein [Vibrio]|uniref:SHOCT domain-containing protein n=1 Tax=Vibrio TaxID=662 RepID=UPI0018F0F79A|nr:SHOCT domain-containing protein [Vibrio cholerae]MBJ6977174.1 SHOCT domain-containing protein [Vibrio cholerae]HDZ9207670.1 SHOCT domain-containing protein [Vibrio cholerae]